MWKNIPLPLQKTPNHPLTACVGGFTLSELLISLAILGVIATFSIPKILQAQQLSANNAKAKEVAAMVSGAFQTAKLAGVVNANTKSSDLIPYMNYVSVDNASVINWTPGFGSIQCGTDDPCLKLHNGGVLVLHDVYPGTASSLAMGGTTSLNNVAFGFDPDGVYSGSTADGPGQGVQFQVYYDGFVTTRGKAKAGSTNAAGSFGPNPSYDPSWFQW